VVARTIDPHNRSVESIQSWSRRRDGRKVELEGTRSYDLVLQGSAHIDHGMGRKQRRRAMTAGGRFLGRQFTALPGFAGMQLSKVTILVEVMRDSD